MPCATSWASIAARSDEAWPRSGRGAALVRRKHRCCPAEAWRPGKPVSEAEKRDVGSESAEQRHEEGHAEVDQKAVVDGDDDKALARRLRDDGQRRVHRRGSSGRDGCQRAEPPRQQRGEQQRQDFARDVGQERHRAQFRPLVFRDEDAGQRVVAEARAHGQAVARRTVRQHQADHGRASQRAHHGAQRQEHQPRAE